MSKRIPKRANGADAPIGRDVWLGSEVEKNIAWLQDRMAEPVSGVERFNLATQARQIRHGVKTLTGRTEFSFGRALDGVKLPAVH
jgi:hypothetical protein